MKKLFAGLMLAGTCAFASAQTITFNPTTIDYGTIKPNADGNRVFTVKNTGDKPLVISSVVPSCGCTSPEWSKDPIMPGKTGQIKVHYDTSRVGAFQKLIEVFSNDPVNSRSVVYIKGDVNPEASDVPQTRATENSATAKSVTEATTRKTVKVSRKAKAVK